MKKSLSTQSLEIHQFLQFLKRMIAMIVVILKMTALVLGDDVDFESDASTESHYDDNTMMNSVSIVLRVIFNRLNTQKREFSLIFSQNEEN